MVDVGVVFNGLMGLDIGLGLIKWFSMLLFNVGIIFWNGLMGVFEFLVYVVGIRGVVEVIVVVIGKGVFSVVGGGDFVVVVCVMNIFEGVFLYIFIGGGVLLEYFEGKMFFGIEVLSCE